MDNYRHRLSGNAEMIVSAETVTILLSTSFWIHWSNIAIAHEHMAKVARMALVAARDRQENYSDFLGDEADAALVAVTAASFAIDAFYGRIRDGAAVPGSVRVEWKERRTARYSIILETLKHGFELGRQQKQFAEKLEWLFKLRDSAVHFEEKQSRPVPHPAGTITSPELVEFCMEASSSAVDLILELFEACIEHPRPKRTELVAFAKGHANVVQALCEKRNL